MKLKDVQYRKAAKSQITRIFNWIEENANQENDIKQYTVRNVLLKD